MVLSLPANTGANGVVERRHLTLEAMLRKSHANMDWWEPLWHLANYSLFEVIYSKTCQDRSPIRKVPNEIHCCLHHATGDSGGVGGNTTGFVVVFFCVCRCIWFYHCNITIIEFHTITYLSLSKCYSEWVHVHLSSSYHSDNSRTKAFRALVTIVTIVGLKHLYWF